MRAVAGLFLCFLCLSSAYAGDRKAKVQELMKAQGLVEMFDQQIMMTKRNSQEQARKALDQLMVALNPPAEFQTKFQGAMTDYVKAVCSPWTAEQVVEVWAKYYGKNFTDHELDQLIAHYNSPLGQKDVSASKQALVQFTNHFAEESKPLIERGR